MLKGIDGVDDENGTTLRPWLRQESGPMVMSLQGEPAQAGVSYVHVRDSGSASAQYTSVSSPRNDVQK